MAAEGLAGRWRLLSWPARTAAGDVTYPFGERPQGSAVYTPGGWMSGTLAYADRADLATGDVVGGSEEERAAAFSTYLSYCGTYEVEGDVVVHHIEMACSPTGSEASRSASSNPLTTSSSSGPPPLETGGDVIVNELRWIREE